MKLLYEIIELLSSDKPNLENALFKTQVVAHQLGELSMKEWVVNELKGYPDVQNLPTYRILPVTVLANLTNGFARYSNHPLPMMGVQQQVREKLETQRVSQSISVVNKWITQESKLGVVIAPEYFSRIKKGLEPSFEIERAWSVHSVGAMLQVVTEVRSRLLELALQMSDRIPKEPTPETIKQLAKDVAVSDLFRNAVFGSNTTIVVGSGSIENVANSVLAKDLHSLLNALRAKEIQDSDLEDLQIAFNLDKESNDVKQKKIGPSVRKWIAGMVTKAADGAWDMSIATAGSVLAAAINSYYGIGGT